MNQAIIATRRAYGPISDATDDDLYLMFQDKLGRPPRRDTVHIYLGIMRAFQSAGVPQTVRQIFYQCTVLGVVDKTENGYHKVADHLLNMRRAGIVRYDWVADNTRWMRKPRTYDNLQEFLKISRDSYRRALWAESDAYVELWCEKDALAGVLAEVTDSYDVPLMVSRGFASESYLFEAAQTIKAKTAAGKRAYVYHFGDYDPSGVAARHAIERSLQRFGARVEFEAVAVNAWQIVEWSLPSRPTKKTDSRSKSWLGGDSVELDAIPADWLQHLAEDCITRHIDQERIRKARLAEVLERQSLDYVIESLTGDQTSD